MMENISEHFLHRFFYPESVALIGASGNPLRINHHLVANLVNLGYKGRIYPIHPKEKEILGIKAYPDVKSVGEVVDLAVVAVSQMQTPGLLRECIDKGIKRVVLVAGGFSEIGEEGRRIQGEMARLVRQSGIRTIGPNALSPINPRIGFSVSFHPLERLLTGGLSLIFQSGLYEPRLHWLFHDFNLHLNKLIDLGNKMDLNEVDALSYLVHDPLSRVIGIHLESIEGDGGRFLELIGEAAALGKPVVVLKSGRTEEGAKAAASHTGVLVQGNDLVFDSILKQFGAIRAYTIEEFFNIARAMERFGTLSLPGNRVAVATLPGGEAVVMTDLVPQEGMAMAKVTEATMKRLRPVFPPWEIPVNPFDLGVTLQFGNPIQVYETLVESMIEDPNVDALHIQVPDRLFVVPKEVFKLFAKAPEAGKPLVLWVAGIEPGTQETLQWLEELGIPVFPGPEKALRALAALYRLSLSRKDRFFKH
ncbi:MAG: CoA-binding protein [Deltaproteobacteria bacterium]|nr:CoA-binding protein [Deltaproteobacteria bacterium]